MVGLGVLKVVVKAVELTRLEKVSGVARRGRERASPSHETVVVTDKQETQTCQRRHGREEETALKSHDCGWGWGRQLWLQERYANDDEI